jgi:acetoacetyl-CoA reductase
MTGRAALVTGGTGAIGREMCRTLHAAGYRVAANCYPADEENARAWIADCEQEGMPIHLEVFDVADYESASEGVRRVEESVGPIDVLVNAAGITRDATLVKMEPDKWSSVLRTNLDSAYNVTRPVVAGMVARGFGRIVNISSVNGQQGQFGQANYSAAKAGLHGFTMAVAREVARKGVTVNTVSPGYIQSPMIMRVPEKVRDSIRDQIPVGRFGDPSEIARAVMFLVADEAGYITGADLSVNGGYHMG